MAHTSSPALGRILRQPRLKERTREKLSVWSGARCNGYRLIPGKTKKEENEFKDLARCARRTWKCLGFDVDRRSNTTEAERRGTADDIVKRRDERSYWIHVEG